MTDTSGIPVRVHIPDGNKPLTKRGTGKSDFPVPQRKCRRDGHFRTKTRQDKTIRTIVFSILEFSSYTEREAVKIQYFSDIHLEFGSVTIPETDADVIIAAGDIGIYKQGVEWLKTLKKPVIYVAGNHEFYENELNATLSAIRAESRGSNVTFLENEKLMLEGIRFLGCTLWSDLGGDEDDRIGSLQRTVNDFRKIRYGVESFDMAVFRQLHQQSRDWLERELKKPFRGKTVVVTHHAPTQWSWNDSPNAVKRYAYCSDLKSLLHEYDVSAWIHGHTHSPSDYRCAGARILCNPRGYLGKKIVDDFNPARVVDL